MSYDEDAHARFRRAFVHSFSEKSFRDQAPVIERYVDLFIKQLKALEMDEQRTSKTVDLNQWFNYLTFDVAGDLSFGESFDCLRHGKAHLWVDIAQGFGKGLALVASVNLYSPFDRLFRHIIPKKIIQRDKDHREMSAIRARKRLALNTDRPDFVTPAKRYSDRKAAISTAEWEINMAVVVFAASETTASALTAIVRELVQHEEILRRLVQMVRGSFENESEITMASTGNLPYLNAVINEGLRLDPPVVIGIPRVVPHGGDIICGRWVPGGVCMVLCHSLHLLNGV